MQPYDFTTPGTPPQSIWQRHGGFIVVMALLLGVIAWTHLGSGTPAGSSAGASAQPSRAWADLRGIAFSIADIIGQIAVLLVVVRIFWPIIRFVGTIVIGAGLLGILWHHGFF